MKKSKLLVLGLIALALAGGLVLASCSVCPGGLTSGGAGGCTFSLSSEEYKDCEDLCIQNQAKNLNDEPKELKCDC